jgi:transcription elongation factor/antiterminator RfaH
MPNQWYALRSKPRKEDVVWRQLRLDGVEVFYPRLSVNPVNPRSKKIKPYFPGYLFVNIDIEQTGISRFQWMPHTIGLVSFGGEPAHVPENLIIELQKRVAEIAEAGGEVFDGLKAGDKVRISNGPFQGYEAIFDARVSGTERVRVLLELLTNKRRVPIELSSGSIEKKKK